MNKENKLNFNSEPLLIEINNIIQNGVNNLLNDFISNYKLYEETHNCIMNLPSVKREIAKNIETYKNDENEENSDDLPDLINTFSHEENTCDSYTRIPVEDDLDQDFNDTILYMKKVTNQLLKEKEETNALFQEEINAYKEIIEKCNTEIAELKNQLKNGVVVCDLTNDEEEENIENIEIKVEKENIILHIEETNNIVLEEEEDDDQTDEEDEDEEDEEEEVIDEEEEVEEEEEEADEVVEEAEEEEEDQAEADEEEDQAEVEEEAEAEVEEEAEAEVEEEAEDQEDEVETEESEEEEEEEQAQEQVQTEAEEEEELFEIEIDDVTYCTNDEENGFIYEIDKEGNVGDIIGHFKDSEPFFN